MNLETAQIADFADRVGDSFQIRLDSERAVSMELVEAKGLGFNPGPGGGKVERESFSLLFRAPTTWRYPQGIYQVAHPALGEWCLFLVPIGPDDRGMRLEAIFNFA